ESRHLLTRLLPSHLDVPLPTADWQSWHTHTGGWPLAVSVLLRRDATTLPTPPQGSAQPPAPTDPTIDGLVAITAMLQALLADLPPQIQNYLLVSALPHRFSHVLCSELLNLSRQESAQQLAEILRRNLFLQADEQPGWYRYHDLIRESLGTLAEARLGADTSLHLRTHCADWFAAQGDLPAAIDHALLAENPQLAAHYLCQLPTTYVVDQGIFRTYQRWISSLDEATQAQYPLLLIQLGRSRLEIGDRRGAHTWLQRALIFAHAAQDKEHIWQAQTALAKLHNMEGNLAQSLALCEAVIAQSPPTHPAHVQALNAAGNAYTQLNRFRMARRHFEQALSIVAQNAPVDGDPVAQEAQARMAANLRHNLTMGIYIPMGQFGAAYAQLEINDRYYATRPVARSMHLLVWCALHETIGDWDALAHDLVEIDAAEAQSEHPDEENIWYYWFKALHATGTGNFDAAQQILNELTPMMVSDEDVLCLDYVRVWCLRRMGEWEAAQRIAQAALTSTRVGPFYRGMLALEYLQSRWGAQTATAPTLDWVVQREYSVSVDPLPHGLVDYLEGDKLAEELQGLLQTRAQPWIVRVRAYMACYTYTTQYATQYAAQPQSPALATATRRHMDAVLRITEQKFYNDILILRDPELGLDFWLLCLACQRAPARAGAALLALAQADNGL
ncbi:MAG: tetratricopeptide repeat protein, partial [Litorilinea sp.]